MKATRVLYEGYVQGVGFRWTTKHIARGYEVCGCVSNLQDGRVELQVGGGADEAVAFLRAIREHAWRPQRRGAHGRNRNSQALQRFSHRLAAYRTGMKSEVEA
jgi:acylphosphatase